MTLRSSDCGYRYGVVRRIGLSTAKFHGDIHKESTDRFIGIDSCDLEHGLIPLNDFSLYHQAE